MWKKDASSLNLAATISARKDVQLAARRARSLLKKRALISAAASTIPVPGLDWATDAALLSRLYPRINEEFGLTPEQLDALNPGKREQVQKAIAMVGSVLIGKLVTRDMVLRLTNVVGMRMTTKQAAKYVPLAGQLTAAALGYATLRYLGERHIQDCIRVVEQSQLDIPSRDIPSRIRKTADLVQRSESQTQNWQRADSTSAADGQEKPSRNWQKRMRSPWQSDEQP